ncbi:Protein phosphatase 1 regulatory subunit 14B, partial [Nibea albiflora]
CSRRRTKQRSRRIRKLGKLTVKYNRKDLQRRLDIEEWIDGQLHLLFDCEEEEIPELEIDIDELLELTDEGQRTRLQFSKLSESSIQAKEYEPLNTWF